MKTERIHRKYDVKRTDGSSEPGGKHEHCAYFVLDLEHDEYAITALTAYARACRAENPELARDLRAMIAAQLDLEAARCNCREVGCPHSLGQSFTHSASDATHQLMNDNKDGES